MAKRKVNRKPRAPWPKFLVDKALELLAETRNATETRKLLSEAFDFGKGQPPARSTLQAWAKREDIAVDVDAGKARDTTAATEARLDRLDEARMVLSERLLEKLTSPAVDQIASRLEEAQKAEELVSAAREAYQDALKMVPMTRDAMADADPVEVRKALKEVWRVVGEARAELSFAMDFRIGIRDLVGIVTRGLGDHLALEGLGVGEDETHGDLIVEHSIPRPDRPKADAGAVPEHKLKVIPGGA